MMKNRFTLSFGFCVLILLLISCEQEESFVLLELDGAYNGSFTVEYENGNTYTNPVTVTFDGDNYLSSIGENRFPAGGSGSYEAGEGRITFTDTNFYTADFDWNLLLSGEYTVLASKTEIVISSEKNELGVYTYRLNRE